ncbi:MAG: M56 family metallopeptidase [Lachnospiraceae bacterium]|nr:M56 family metallopeptidase [Lachnospiraceae bacterium]
MNLLQLSFSGAVFIIAIVMIRAAAVNKLPKKTFLFLWKMVLLRLLIPFSIPSIFSVYTLMNNRIYAPAFFEAETGDPVSVIPQEQFFKLSGIEQLPANTPSPVSVRFTVFFAIWCVGMIIFTMFFVISYLRCQIAFQTAFPVHHAFVEQWIKECSLKRPISIKQSDRIFTPLTYGIYRPVILMPKNTDWENVKQLQYIFAHEYVHICRFDAFTKLVAALALCIHWFNPFVWIMYILFNRDIELACDESVIRHFGEKSKSAYSLMLINMEAKKSGLLPFCSNFSKNAIEERITAIMRIKRTTPAALIPACLTVFVTTGMFATSAMASNDHAIIHESADILHYEDGAPYIHDILTNNTDKAIVETEYCMLAYDENGSPLELYWNFLDSSTKSSYENLVRTEGKILPHQTEDYRGGWSLYDGVIMDNIPKVGNGEANQVAYSLICLKQVVFEDGTVWNNPEYENWCKTYAGKEIGTDKLESYYPYEYVLK